MEHVYLVQAERRSRVGHHILDATLVQGDDVGLSLHHIHAVFARYGLLGLIDAVELVVLVEEVAVGRVDVFLVDTLRARVEHTRREAHHLSIDTDPREGDAPGVAVDELAVLVLVADARLYQELLLVALLQGRWSEHEAVGQVVAQSELQDDVVAEAAASEILHADVVAVGRMVEKVLKVACRPLVDDEHRLPLALLLTLLIGQFALMDLYVVLVGQPPERLGVGHLLMFHDERDGASSLATAKAMAGAACRRHVERWRLLVVEWAQALVVGPRLSEGHKFRHHIHDVGGFLDSFYCSAINHKYMRYLRYAANGLFASLMPLAIILALFLAPMYDVWVWSWLKYLAALSLLL